LLTTEAGSLGGLSVAVNFFERQVVVSVRGEVDALSAPDLKAMLDALIDRSYRSVVLDLAQMGFIDAAGMRLIVSTAGRLRSRDGQLTLRSPSGLVRRVLEIAVLSGQVHLEADASDGYLYPAQLGRGTATAKTTSTTRAQVRWGMGGDMPAFPEVIHGALGLVVALASQTIDGADGASISLRRDGRLATVATSDEAISEIDVDQYASGQGPCVDASLKGQPSHVYALEQERRWPTLVTRARQLGIGAILSSPLVAGGQPVGALNVYSRTAGAFAAKEQELASVLAAHASVILTSAIAGDFLGALGDGPPPSPRAQEVIAQALGVVMESDGLSEEDAFTTLRRFSQPSARPVK
jgi:anti-anti-sigma factor